MRTPRPAPRDRPLAVSATRRRFPTLTSAAAGHQCAEAARFERVSP